MVVEVIIGLAMLVLSFMAIGASDDTALGAKTYWSLLVAVFAVATFIIDRMHTGHSFADLGSAWKIVLHLAGVLAAIHLVFYFTSTGRMAIADTGLSIGLVFGLGTFLAGVHVNWRLMVVGVAVACATAVVAFVEQHMWFLVGLGVLAAIVLIVGSMLVRSIRRKPEAVAG